MAAQVLVIEDDASLSTLLEYNLEAEGYEVRTAPSAEDGKTLLAEEGFDLVVLDWMLPDMSGIAVVLANCGARTRPHRLPILMLTARGEEADRVRGLATGADDYVVKPFSVPELMARVRALLRRLAPERISDVLSVGNITMDRDAHRVSRGAREIDLGPTEYRLLEVLLESAGRVLSRQQLIDRVWSSTAEIDERTIDVHIGRLRRALVRGNDADPIRTVRGAGYALDGT